MACPPIGPRERLPSIVHEPSASWALMPLPSMRSNSLLLIVTCASALPPAMLMPSPPIGPFERFPSIVQEPSASEARRASPLMASKRLLEIVSHLRRDTPCSPKPIVHEPRFGVQARRQR